MLLQIYFLLTDRFAPSPGVKPAACSLHDWNNGEIHGFFAFGVLVSKQ
jgi:hypothetical protein